MTKNKYISPTIYIETLSDEMMAAGSVPIDDSHIPAENVESKQATPYFPIWDEDGER